MHAEPRALLRFVLTTLSLLGGAQLLAAEEASQFSPEEVGRGRKLFTVHCARCHGMQGLGGTGPSLARQTLTQAPDDKALASVIESGIPGTPMPGWRYLPAKDKRSLAAFVRSLGTTEEVALPGDTARGQELFAKAGCTQCHSVGGEGGVKGPDLTTVGLRRGADRLRRMLLEPGAEKTTTEEGYFEYLPVRVVMQSGQEVDGLRMNEDGFTLQLRDLDNRLHSFRKADIKVIEKGFERSFMPSFATTFNASELDDVVAYLANLRGKK